MILVVNTSCQFYNVCTIKQCVKHLQTQPKSTSIWPKKGYSAVNAALKLLNQLIRLKQQKETLWLSQAVWEKFQKNSNFAMKRVFLKI